MLGEVKPMVQALAFVLGLVHNPAHILKDDMHLEIRYSKYTRIAPNTVVSRILLLGSPDNTCTGVMG